MDIVLVLRWLGAFGAQFLLQLALLGETASFGEAFNIVGFTRFLDRLLNRNLLKLAGVARDGQD